MSLTYNRRKGATCEIQAADHAKARGFCHAHRRTRTGAKDCGDVFVNELVQSLECKATKAFEPSAFLREAVVEAGHAGSPIPCGLWKVPRKPVGEWLAFMPYDALLDLLEQAQVPMESTVLWRTLWDKAMTDNERLVDFIREHGLEPPHTHTRPEPAK